MEKDKHEPMELKELHNRLEKILKQKSFLQPLSRYFHEIIDDMWKQNPDFIQVDAEKQISKTEYIYKFIKNILHIDNLKWCDEKISGQGDAAIVFDYGNQKTILQVYKKSINLKTDLVHELGHLKRHGIEYYYSKGNATLNILLAEGIAEESAQHNGIAKLRNGMIGNFEYLPEDSDVKYYCEIPQTGYSNVYMVITNIYAQLKTILFQSNPKNVIKKDGESILSQTSFEEVLNARKEDLVKLLIHKITDEIGDRNLAERYLMECICTFETFQYYEFMVNTILESEKKNNIEMFLRVKGVNDGDLQEWNKRLDQYRLDNKSFGDNFIRLQRDFFSIMSKKVEKSKSIEEVYEILRSIEYMKPNLPIVRNRKGTNVTNSQIGIFGFQQAFRNKINQLQEKNNSSIIPIKDSTVAKSGETSCVGDDR